VKRNAGCQISVHFLQCFAGGIEALKNSPKLHAAQPFRELPFLWLSCMHHSLWVQSDFCHLQAVEELNVFLNSSFSDPDWHQL